MLSAFVIALREGVEASLIVGILVAYLVKAGRKDVLKYLWIGVAVAVAVPAGAGAFMTWGPSTLTFEAQEIIGGTLSLIAVGFVTWMIFWMGKNARTLSKELRKAADSALQGGSAMGIAWVAILAVGREGLETALFIWPTVKSGIENGNGAAPIAGLVLGLVAAVVIGYLVYKGSVVINLRSFFTVTGCLLIVVAAGIVAYGLKDLQESGLIPGHGHTVYDFTEAIVVVVQSLRRFLPAKSPHGPHALADPRLGRLSHRVPAAVRTAGARKVLCFKPGKEQQCVSCYLRLPLQPFCLPAACRTTTPPARAGRAAPRDSA